LSDCLGIPTMSSPYCIMSAIERTVYDDLPYKAMPIEWTAPERLALASLLHGGPRARLAGYRVLELGCADGSNLIPMALFRPDGDFVGIDSARSQIALADGHKKSLGLKNVEFVCADLCAADRYVSGEFDFVVAHGVFSWISDATRDAMLEFCARRLRHDSLFYLNYNTYPGWQVRGLIRRLLLARTHAGASLLERALLAQDIAAQLAASIRPNEHPFTQLLVSELNFVSEHHPSYVAHEYLAADNRAYWRSEFLQLAGEYGLEYVADADFNYPSGRMTSGTIPQCLQQNLPGQEVGDDAIDLLCYRQLHSPILCLGQLTRRPHSLAEFTDLTIASCLSGCATEGGGPNRFQHPSGYEVEAKESGMQNALMRLRKQWPKGVRIGDLFDDVACVMDDLKLLHRNGLVELRCLEACGAHESAELLNKMEAQHGGYVTTAYHTREAVPIEWAESSLATPRLEIVARGLAP
jgi:SAM-dependent methyltransferase